MAYIWQVCKFVLPPARCVGRESVTCMILHSSLKNSNNNYNVELWRGMAGHSKWSNIKHIKASKDAEKRVVYNKYSRLLKIAIKEGGGTDPHLNSKLAKVIELALGQNMQRSTIKNVIDTYQKSQDNAKSAIIEYKGPGGVFLLTEVLTDNITRTKTTLHSAVRKLNIQEVKGSIRHLFEEKGVVMVSSQGMCLETAMDNAIEIGAEDVEEHEDNLVFTCSPEDFVKVKQGLENLKYTVNYASVDYLPKLSVSISEEEEKQLDVIIKKLEGIDEVIRVHVNV